MRWSPYKVFFQKLGDVSKLNYVAKHEVRADEDGQWHTAFRARERPGRETGVWKVGVETVLKGSSEKQMK